MGKYVVHRPDGAAMERVLERNVYNAAGVIIRLAWRAGLMRDEIVNLTWDDVNFFDEKLRLPGRFVPLERETVEYLLGLSEHQDSDEAYVVLSDRGGARLAPPSVSRLARTALDAEGLSGIRLIDLRHDFIIRSLETHDWQYVSQISGVDAVTLNTHFAEHAPVGKISTRADKRRGKQIDELRLLRFLQKEKFTISSAILLLSWQAGLGQEEISALTWPQAELSRGVLHLADHDAPIPQSVCDALSALKSAQGDGCEYVVTAPQAGGRMEPNRISKIARAALVRAGMDDVTLRDLKMDYALRAGSETRVFNYMRQHGYITRNDMMEMFGI